MAKSFSTKPVSGLATKTDQESRQNHAWRPKVRIEQDSSAQCPFCHAAVSANDAICPSCGRSQTAEKCSFCGAPKRPTAKFCTRCGQSSQGIICPECGTLNSRNFCRKCNHPLTPMAERAMEEAKNDPSFRRVQQKAVELAELHAKIEQLSNAQVPEERAELSEQDKALLDEYADILGMIGSRPEVVHNSEPEPAARKQYTLQTSNIDDLLAAYKEKAAEMNDALAALTPPPDYTPEQQRDYFAARKVGTMVTETVCDMSEYKPTQWKCNYCGCLHDTPAECTRPELGGVWIYYSIEEYKATHTRVVKTSLKIE